MGCGESCLKGFLFVLNTLCFIGGALILASSIYALNEFDALDEIKIPCILGIVLSSILILISIIGCFGLCRKSVCMNWTYSIIMFLLMAAQIAVILLEPVDFNAVAKESVEKVWNATTVEDQFEMSTYQTLYQCCGKNGPSDYTAANETIPSSCYLKLNTTSNENLFEDGCINKLSGVYTESKLVEEISDWTLVALEGLSSFFGAMMAITLKNVQRRKHYHY